VHELLGNRAHAERLVQHISRAATAIDAPGMAVSRPSDCNSPQQFASGTYVSYFRLSFQVSRSAGKSVKAWHLITLLRICMGVPDFY